jgi:hypothetical protein
MRAPYYVHADVPSANFCYWMFYYTHDSYTDAPQYVYEYVPLDE